jgi:choice-of-anchor C domain-containing protein
MSKSIVSRSVLGGFALLLLASGCAVDSADDEPIPSPEQVKQDSLYAKAMFDQRGKRGAMRLDLSEDRQFALVKNRLLRAGLSRFSSPDLFERLTAARELAVAKKLNAFGRSSHDLLPQDATSPEATPRCDTFLTIDELDPTLFTTQAVATCADGFEQVVLDSNQYDESNNLLASDSEEADEDGAAELLVSSTPPSESVWADSMVMARTSTTTEFFYTATDNLMNHLVVQDTSSVKITMTMSAPTETNWASATPGEIRVCLERGTSLADCDYKHAQTGPCSGDALCDNASNPSFPIDTPTYDPAKLYLPLRGNSPPSVANNLVIDYATAWLTLTGAGATTPAGGLCTRDLTGSPFISLARYTATRKAVVIAPHAMSIGSALWPERCVDHRSRVDLNIEVGTKDPATGVRGPTLTWKSTKNGNYMSIWSGKTEQSMCVAPTLVNGDFEQGPNLPVNQWIALPAGSPALHGWTLSGSGAEQDGRQIWTPASGDYSLDLAPHSSGGMISQTFATVAGARYQVDFSMAGNIYCGPAIKAMEVSAADSTQSYSFSIQGKWNTNMGWERKSFFFTATGATTTLSFRDTTSNTSCGPALDAVSITCAPLDEGAAPGTP